MAAKASCEQHLHMCCILSCRLTAASTARFTNHSTGTGVLASEMNLPFIQNSPKQDNCHHLFSFGVGFFPRQQFASLLSVMLKTWLLAYSLLWCKVSVIYKYVVLLLLSLNDTSKNFSYLDSVWPEVRPNVTEAFVNGKKVTRLASTDE